MSNGRKRFFKNLLLTRIKAVVPGLLFDGHGVKSCLALGAWRWTRGAHAGDPLLCVLGVNELLLESLGVRDRQWF